MKTNILIADDSKENLKLWEICLKLTNINPIFANDGEEAISALKNHKINLAVLDLNMPKKSGYEVIEYIKSNDLDVPVFASTGEDCDYIQEKLDAAGFEGFFEKPFNFKEAIAEIELKLEKKSINA